MGEKDFQRPPVTVESVSTQTVAPPVVQGRKRGIPGRPGRGLIEICETLDERAGIEYAGLKIIDNIIHTMNEYRRKYNDGAGGIPEESEK